MPSSLKSKIKKLYFQGKITELEYHVLINKIDNRSERIRKLLKENKPKETRYVVKSGINLHTYCNNCWYHHDGGFDFSWEYCPNCGYKIKGVNYV